MFLILFGKSLSSLGMTLPSFLNVSTQEIAKKNWLIPNLSRPFVNKAILEEFYYPDWFEGDWKVLSIGDSSNSSVEHEAIFKPDQSGRIIADKLFNTESLARSLFGQDFISLREDPNASNRQLAVFKGNRYLETKVLERNQENNSSTVFSSKETVLQIFHVPDITTINKVETSSRFSLCSLNEFSLDTSDDLIICGEQMQRIYDIPVNNFQSSPIKTNYFRLFLVPLDINLSSEQFLIDHASQKGNLAEGFL